MSDEREIYVVPGPGLGSVQHYHHFIFALLIPLLSQWNSILGGSRLTKLLVESCGPLDRILRDLDLPQVKIIPRNPKLRNMLRARVKQNQIELVTLKRYDFPPLYRAGIFREARDLLLFRYAEKIKSHFEGIDKQFKLGLPRILFINRGSPDKFYSSESSEIKTSGVERRSIPNFDESSAQLANNFGNVVSMTLEGKSIFYQIALFSAVDLIICQHGAALANLVWARPGTRVIEIMPTEVADTQSFNLFGRLASTMSIDFRRMSQESSHAPIDAAELAKLVAESLSGHGLGADIWPGFDATISFAPGSSYNSWLGEGWLEPGPAGTWSVGSIATLRLPLPEISTPLVRLVANARAALGPHRSDQDVRIIVNGNFVGNWHFSRGRHATKRSIDISAKLLKPNEPARVEFHIADPRSAMEMGASKDNRELGIVLKDLVLQSTHKPTRRLFPRLFVA